MRLPYIFISALLALACLTGSAFGQSSKDYLRLVVDTAKDAYAYVNARGDTIIPFGRYFICYTNKFYKWAIVSSEDKGLIGIDRKENVLFNVFIFDNGPDYPSNGLFRIVKDGKIGYADLNGQIVIQPQYDCAYPFKNGKAEVGKGCGIKSDGEHSSWTGGQWVTIDKKGKIIK